MSRNRLIVLALAAVAAIAVLVAALYGTGGGDGNGRPSALAPYLTGQMQNLIVADAGKAPPAAVFKAENGEEVSFETFRGKVVLVNLWATWCAPCRHEMPSLDRLEQALGGDDFQVVAISLDRGGFPEARAFLEEVGAEHLALYNDPSARIGRSLGALGLPATLLLDREGHEVARLLGPAEWDSEEAQALIRFLIAPDAAE